MRIESRSNEIIKRVRSLSSRKGRQEQGMHLAEGYKLVQEALSSRMPITQAFIEDGSEGSELEVALAESGTNVYTVSKHVMEAICQTKTPQWVCAVVKTPKTEFPSHTPQQGMLVALDTIQDPGNLGTIIRTADAMGAKGVLLSEGCADAYSPKSIRSAMGSTYHIPLWRVGLKEALQKLHIDGYCCICGHLQGQEALPHLTDRCVIVIGNEGSGVAEVIAALCVPVRLPIYGRAESLNASVAAGILMYEVAKAMHEHKKS